jgi:hypothetical protein
LEAANSNPAAAVFLDLLVGGALPDAILCDWNHFTEAAEGRGG